MNTPDQTLHELCNRFTGGERVCFIDTTDGVTGKVPVEPHVKTATVFRTEPSDGAEPKTALIQVDSIRGAYHTAKPPLELFTIEEVRQAIDEHGTPDIRRAEPTEASILELAHREGLANVLGRAVTSRQAAAGLASA